MTDRYEPHRSTKLRDRVAAPSWDYPFQDQPLSTGRAKTFRPAASRATWVKLQSVDADETTRTSGWVEVPARIDRHVEPPPIADRAADGFAFSGRPDLSINREPFGSSTSGYCLIVETDEGEAAAVVEDVWEPEPVNFVGLSAEISGGVRTQRWVSTLTTWVKLSVPGATPDPSPWLLCYASPATKPPRPSGLVTVSLSTAAAELGDGVEYVQTSATLETDREAGAKAPRKQLLDCLRVASGITLSIAEVTDPLGEGIVGDLQRVPNAGGDWNVASLDDYVRTGVKPNVITATHPPRGGLGGDVALFKAAADFEATPRLRIVADDPTAAGSLLLDLGSTAGSNRLVSVAVPASREAIAQALDEAGASFAWIAGGPLPARPIEIGSPGTLAVLGFHLRPYGASIRGAA